MRRQQPHTAICACALPLQSKLTGKAPFSQYANVPGLNVVWGNPADAAAIPSGGFDVVYDNNGKDMEACQPLIDHFKVRRRAFFVLFLGALFVGFTGLAWHCRATRPALTTPACRLVSAGQRKALRFCRQHRRYEANRVTNWCIPPILCRAA